MGVTDAQVRKLMEEVNKHGKIGKASMMAGLDRKTGAKYRDLNKVPSEIPKPSREHLTHEDPFDAIWPVVEKKLELATNLQAKALFNWLKKQNPGMFQDTQLRTFQRRVKKWRATKGPDQEVFFAQDHRPGEAMQMDFTHCNKLGITINGVPFEHMLCHCVLPHSNWEWASVCRSESLIALRNGVQASLFKLGRYPEYLQTDSLTAATHDLGGGARDFNKDYREFVAHFKMKPRRIAVRKCNQNGDVESSNNALKNCLKQHLILQESRDFKSIEAYEIWVRKIITENNIARSTKLADELKVMKKLTANAVKSYREEDVKVSRESTISILRNTYSVPSRLIGERLKVRVYDHHIEVLYGGSVQLKIERLLGRKKSRINYRHVIKSLVRKPGAFARYRYQSEMFPAVEFREAYDALHRHYSTVYKADLEYLRILQKAAFESEEDVLNCLQLLQSQNILPDYDTIKALIKPQEIEAQELNIPKPSLSEFDDLLDAPELLKGHVNEK